MSQEEIIFNLIFFIVVFILAFIVILLANKYKLKKRKTKDIMELSYIKNKFKIDIKKLNIKKEIIIISILDSFIISFVATFISILKIHYIWQILIGFIILVALIYSIYELYGRHLKKKLQKEETN